MHKSLENYLAADDGAGKLVAHASLLFKLAQIYQSIAPVHLRQASRLANYKSGIVVVHAASGAVAAIFPSSSAFLAMPKVTRQNHQQFRSRRRVRPHARRSSGV